MANYGYIPQLRFKGFDDNNAPLVGGKLYSYIAGTNTPLPLYVNKTGSPASNPVILNARGEAQVYMGDSFAYKLVLKDSNDVTVWTEDNVTPSGGSGSSGVDELVKVSGQDELAGYLSNKLLAGNGVSFNINVGGAAGDSITISTDGKSKVSSTGAYQYLQDAIISANSWINVSNVGDKVVIDASPLVNQFGKIKFDAGDALGYFEEKVLAGTGITFTRVDDTLVINCEAVSLINAIADTATIDLDATGGTLTANVVDGSIGVSKLNTADVDARYLPKTFNTTQVLLNTADNSQFVFNSGGQLVLSNASAGYINIRPDSGDILFYKNSNGASGVLDGEALLTAPRTWTLPNASGTIALTSNLSDYVLKTGDTMSGALTISNNTGGNMLFLNSGTSNPAQIRFKGNSNTSGWRFGTSSATTGNIILQNDDTSTTTLQIDKTTNNATFSNRVTAGALSSNGDLSVGTTSVFNGNNTHQHASDIRSIYTINSVQTGQLQAVANNFRVVALAGSNLEFFTNGAARGSISNTTNEWTFNSTTNYNASSIFNSNNTHQHASDIRSTYRVNSVNVGQLQAIPSNFRVQALDGNNLEFWTNSASRGSISSSNNQWTFNTQINGSIGVFSDYFQLNRSISGSALILNRSSDAVSAFDALSIRTNNTTRWFFRIDGTETGSDTGARLSIMARADDGSSLGNVIEFNRAAGSAITLSRPLSATTGTFSGLISASTAPTLGQHLTNKTYVDGQISGLSTVYQPLNSNLTALSSLSGTSGLIRRTGSSYVYDNTIYATLTDLGNYLPLAGGTMSGAINMGGTNVNGVQQLQFINNANTAYITTHTGPIIYSSNGSSAYPFNEAGNLIISPRISGAARDVIISTLGTKADLTVDRSGNTLLLGNLNIGDTVSYANMPTTSWQSRIGTSTSGAVDDGALVRWTNRVSGTNATGYVLRWFSESRSGASLGAEVERMNLTNSALTIFPSSGQGLIINSSVSGSQIRFLSADAPSSGWRFGISSDALADYIVVNDNLSTVPLRIARADDTITASGRVVTSASTTTRAGLNIPHGTAPTTPVNGDIWTTTSALQVRVNGTTRTAGLLGFANDWANIQTSRGWALTRQAFTPTGTTQAMTLTSGNLLDLILTSSAGNVTVTMSAASAGVESILQVTGHASAARDVSILQASTVIQYNGTVSSAGATVNLGTTPAGGKSTYRMLWITATYVVVHRVSDNLGTGFITNSGHNTVSMPWSVGNNANWTSATGGIQIDTTGTYGAWIKGNTLIEQAVSQALTLYKPVSATNEEVCVNFDLQSTSGAQRTYAQICGKIVDGTNLSHDGELELNVAINGALPATPKVRINEYGVRTNRAQLDVTVTSIKAGLTWSGVTTGTRSGGIHTDGVNWFFTGLGTGVNPIQAGGSNVTINAGDTVVAFTTNLDIDFERVYFNSTTAAVGGTELKFTIGKTGSAPYTYTVRAETTYTVTANNQITLHNCYWRGQLNSGSTI